MSVPIQKVVIVGANLTGFCAAAYVTSQLKGSGLQVEIIDDGSGEYSPIVSTQASVNSVFQSMGLDLRQLMAATDAAFNLGQAYEGWLGAGSWAFNSFTAPPNMAGFFEFQHFWLKSMQSGNVGDYHQYSLAAMAARQGKFAFPSPANPNPLTQLSFGLNFNSAKLMAFMRSLSINAGVKVADGTLQAVESDENGTVSAVLMSTGLKVQGDFFIDCSLLAKSVLDSHFNLSFHSRYETSPVNRTACIVLNNQDEPLLPQTSVRALPNGWLKQCSDQNRTATTFVYNSNQLTDQEVAIGLLQHMVNQDSDEQPPADVVFSELTPGNKVASWVDNCLFIGAGTFQSCQLDYCDFSYVFKALESFVKLFPHNKNSYNSHEYNRWTQADYNQLLDYECLAMSLAANNETEFWISLKKLELSEAMQHQLALFKSHGRLIDQRQALIAKHQWAAMLISRGVIPVRNHPLMSVLDQADGLPELQSQIGSLVAGMPSHRQFLLRFCQQ